MLNVLGVTSPPDPPIIQNIQHFPCFEHIWFNMFNISAVFKHTSVYIFKISQVSGTFWTEKARNRGNVEYVACFGRTYPKDPPEHLTYSTYIQHIQHFLCLEPFFAPNLGNVDYVECFGRICSKEPPRTLNIINICNISLVISTLHSTYIQNVACLEHDFFYKKAPNKWHAEYIEWFCWKPKQPPPRTFNIFKTQTDSDRQRQTDSHWNMPKYLRPNLSLWLRFRTRLGFGFDP